MRWLLLVVAWNAWAQNNDALRAAREQQRAAAAVQREAGRKQAELAGPGPLEHLLTPMWQAPACEPMPEPSITPLLQAAADGQALDVKLVRAVARQESAFYPCAVSVHGARGLMQLMPVVIERFQVHDPFDPKQNLEGGARYLKQLLDKYQGDLALALSAYRIGPTVVDSANGVPDLPEVRSYVDAILQTLATPPAPPQIQMPKPTGN